MQVLPWDPNYKEQIKQDFTAAIETCVFNNSPLRGSSLASKQTVGNTMARFLSRRLNAHLKQFKIGDCEGAGYPDRCLVHPEDNQEFALEFKATGELFDPEDKNRMVLISSSDKMRRRFPDPVSHLLVAVCYRRVGKAIAVCSFGFKFFQPWTLVNIRLEASTSKSLLSSEPENFLWIPVNAGKPAARLQNNTQPITFFI